MRPSSYAPLPRAPDARVQLALPEHVGARDEPEQLALVGDHRQPPRTLLG